MGWITRTFVLAAAALVGATACASTDEAGQGAEVTIEVHNNFAGAATQEISIYAEGSTPRKLGTITAGETKTFTARAMELAEQHRLIADALSGGTMRSPAISVEPGDRLVWDLSTNRIYVEG